MKKILFALTFAVIISILTFASACDVSKPSHSGSGSTGSDKNPPAAVTEEQVLQKLTELTEKGFLVVTLTITTEYSGFTLTDTFTVNFSADTQTVNYNVQEPSVIDPEKPLPDSMYTEKTGVATVSGGVVTNVSGDNVSIDFSKLINAFDFDFTKSNFSESRFTESTFNANVANPKAFFKNNNFAGANVKVDVSMGSKLNSISVNYETQDGAKVKLNYQFN